MALWFKEMRICMLLLACSASVWAEYRIWTDTQGRTVEAEYVRTEVETVVLRRKEDYREITININDLSDKDRRYALLQVPPRLGIKVESNLNRKVAGYVGNFENTYRIQYELIDPTVTISKLSIPPYEAPMTFHLVLIGRVKETGRYIILDAVSVAFSFTGETSREYVYEGQPIDLEQLRGSLRMGVEYTGYLVVVRDYKHQIFETKASKSDMLNHAEELIKAPPGTLLRKDMRPTKVQRPAHDRGSSLPGRVF